MWNNIKNAPLKIISLLILGSTSGILVGLIATESSYNKFYLLSGTVFGAFFAIYIFIFKKVRSLTKRLWYWLLISTLSWFFVVGIGLRVSDSVLSNPSAAYSPITYFILMGTVGALVLSIGFHFLFAGLRLHELIIPIFLGGILAIVGPLELQILNVEIIDQALVFILWQTTMMFVFAWYLEKEEVH